MVQKEHPHEINAVLRSCALVQRLLEPAPDSHALHVAQPASTSPPVPLVLAVATAAPPTPAPPAPPPPPQPPHWQGGQLSLPPPAPPKPVLSPPPAPPTPEAREGRAREAAADAEAAAAEHLRAAGVLLDRVAAELPVEHAGAVDAGDVRVRAVRVHEALEGGGGRRAGAAARELVRGDRDARGVAAARGLEGERREREHDHHGVHQARLRGHGGSLGKGNEGPQRSAERGAPPRPRHLGLASRRAREQ